MPYESLLQEAEQQEIYTYEKPMKSTIKGLYADNVICINQNQIKIEKTCAIAEELGHYHTSTGDIIDQSNLSNRKQERRARQWAHNRLVPLSSIVQAFHARVKGRHEIAEFFRGNREVFAGIN